jgi:hypothetical protein
LLVPQPIRIHPGQGEEVLRSSLFYFAKTLHVTAYALFALLTCWLRVGGLSRAGLFGFLVLHAGATEYTQYVMAIGRTGSLRDVGLNLAGIGLGAALGWWTFTPRPAPAAPAAAHAPHDRG